MLTVRSWVWVMVLAGCQAGDVDGALGRPFDVTQTRVQSASGDRWEAQFTGPIRSRPNKDRHYRPSNGDWNYNVGGDVNSAVAIYNSAFLGGPLVASCSDKLFVATTAGGLYAFDRLSRRPPGAAADCATPARDRNC